MEFQCFYVVKNDGIHSKNHFGVKLKKKSKMILLNKTLIQTC